MKRLSAPALLALLLGTTAPALATEVTEAELMKAATKLGQQYDANYAKKDPAGMAALYATDGLLVSPSGPIVRGRDALTSYYTKRFASGAHDHAIKIVEVHVTGNGGYGLAQFSVTVPHPNGELAQVHGSIVAIYQHDPDGWHMSLVEPSVPEPAGK
ncbi:MAG: nuclear transport factor 2 family protein [Aliidongia sp.]